MVQRHRARRLHYDLRFEVDGVLVSWAVPRGPTLDPKARRMAVHVEDHPMEYEDFEGVIPAGEYGGGDVIVWDRGTWEPYGTDDPAAAGELHADVHGSKLHGRLVLVRRGGCQTERAAGHALGLTTRLSTGVPTDVSGRARGWARARPDNSLRCARRRAGGVRDVTRGDLNEHPDDGRPDRRRITIRIDRIPLWPRQALPRRRLQTPGTLLRRRTSWQSCSTGWAGSPPVVRGWWSACGSRPWWSPAPRT
ncbi:DNA polymerase ligase N-terminal domain-containing protein [Cellulomonas fimi]|uniref:DNA polymerase ligase N-terminal domain-containing protein n=1 Tax=Cellulomonas fimi TaxID=1708 RepID=UPI00289335BF|nr:DNA polymerase ligase N-terminal domain-containing protein [Cellulomonas fimi]